MLFKNNNNRIFADSKNLIKVILNKKEDIEQIYLAYYLLDLKKKSRININIYTYDKKYQLKSFANLISKNEHFPLNHSNLFETFKKINIKLIVNRLVDFYHHKKTTRVEEFFSSNKQFADKLVNKTKVYY